MNDTAKIENEIREKRFARLSWIGYVISWVLTFSSPIIGAVMFIASAGLAWVSLSSAPRSANSSRGMWLLLIAVVTGPGLLACWVRYNNEADSHHFKAYLRQHACKYEGEIVVGMSKGGCDRAGNCEEPEEIEESQFFCATTGRRITFSQFREGYFGE
jgi:hypothetical protein